MKHIRNVTIFLKEGLYRICPTVLTTEGATLSGNLVIFLHQTAGLNELCTKTLEALKMPWVIVPHPMTSEERKISHEEWYKVMKIKSWRSFAKGAKDLSIYLHDNNRIEIVPTRHGPPQGFFAFLPEKARSCSADDPESLGQAIIDAFSDCE